MFKNFPGQFILMVENQSHNIPHYFFPFIVASCSDSRVTSLLNSLISEVAMWGALGSVLFQPRVQRTPYWETLHAVLPWIFFFQLSLCPFPCIISGTRCLMHLAPCVLTSIWSIFLTETSSSWISVRFSESPCQIVLFSLQFPVSSIQLELFLLYLFLSLVSGLVY